LNCRGETDSEFRAGAGFLRDEVPATVAVLMDTIKDTHCIISPLPLIIIVTIFYGILGRLPGRTAQPGFDWQWRHISLLAAAIGPTDAPLQWVSVVKRPVRDAYHSPASSADGKVEVGLYLHMEAKP